MTSSVVAQSPARIGIDGYNLALPHGTGVASYARSLCTNVSALGHPVDLVYGLHVPADAVPQLRESIFFARLGDGPSSSSRPSLRGALRRKLTLPIARTLVEVPRQGRVIAPDMAGRIPAADRLFTAGGIFETSERFFRRYGRFMPLRMPDPPAVMHWTYPLPLRLEGAANIYTIHDLVPLRLPHTSLEDKAYYHRLIKACISGGDHIATVSETSRADILSLFDAPPERISNTYQAVDVAGADAIAKEHLDDWLRRLFDLRLGGYFLFFSAIEPKKNLGRLIHAYLEKGIETPLVIVGSQGWRSEPELRLLNGAHGSTLTGAANIRRLDYLPRTMLLALIRGARAVASPSLYEGFGLPTLEAMALGVPVVTSAAGATAEVASDAALTVDPYDTGAIGSALCALDRDADLRARLARAGLRRAEFFSEARYRMGLQNLYARVHRGRESVAAKVIADRLAQPESLEL